MAVELHPIHLVMEPETWLGDTRTGVMSYPSNSSSSSGELTFTKSVQVANYAVLVQKFRRETVQSTTKYWIGELIVLDLNVMSLNRRMKEIYCGFAANQDLEIAPTNQYGSSQQLMARTKYRSRDPLF